MGNETAVISKDMFGDQLYQSRARKALPVLVRQAIAAKTIYYQHLADELGMPNPRNLNYVLGSVGQSLIALGERWGKVIPPIQCLVINQLDQMPGEGFGWFMPDKSEWQRLSKHRKLALVREVTREIYLYDDWMAVLNALELAPLKEDFSDLLSAASTFRAGGEGEAHRSLKELVRRNPEVAGVPRRCGPGTAEKRIPSGDCIDVFFDAGDEWVGVEVKPELSGPDDITRGLFQCVKYRAVLDAILAVEQKQVTARSVLVLGGELPARLRSLKHTLGVEVFENVGR